MVIESAVRPDFSKLETIREFERQLLASYRGGLKSMDEVPVERPLLENSSEHFLMPLSITWRKPINGKLIDNCQRISEDRKKVFRTACNQAATKGVKVEVEYPLCENSFKRFKDYYDGYMCEMGYAGLLNDQYFQNKDVERGAIHLFSAEGEYLGGRLFTLFQNKMTADFRAVKRENVIKEGYDTLCEKAFYEAAANFNKSYLTLGSEVNLRGVGERKLGLVLNKIKYGYYPHALYFTPRMYVDLSFLKEKEFDLVFFVSVDNESESKETEKLRINFVLNNQDSLDTINTIKSRLGDFEARVYDKNFQLIN